MIQLSTGLFSVGKINMKVQRRDCMVTDLEDGCYTSDTDLKNFFNEILSFAMGFEVDGKVCYCSEDLCIAECGSDSWQLGTLWSVYICVPWNVMRRGF